MPVSECYTVRRSEFILLTRVEPVVRQTIASYLQQLGNVLRSLPVSDIERVVDTIVDARAKRATVFLVGNGGSAATASHFACDLAKGTLAPGQPRLRVVALTDNVPLLTAWANDTDYDNVFSEQLQSLVQPGDVVVAISGSGNSPNVLKAVQVGKEAGAVTIGLTGFQGGRLKELVDICVIVPVDHMGQVEDGHMILDHLITDCVKEACRGR